MPGILPEHFDDEDFLPARLAIAKFKAEKIEPQLAQYRLWDHDSFRDFNRRKGVVLHSSRFIQRLRQLEPRFVIQQQINYINDWGLYIQRGNRLVHICPISKGWLTEFSWTEVDQRNLPTDPHWGWRTVLVRCLSKGVLKWDQVINEFQDSLGANSERWLQATSPFRNLNATALIHHNSSN